MQYLYHPDASHPSLELEGDQHRYLFKVRRHKSGEDIFLRNLRDQILYRYRIESLDKKCAHLLLQDHEIRSVGPSKMLHIGWCIIDPKSIEKVLPTLNEMGVARITFIMCARSQKNFTIDFKRLEKILLSSSQQCGRSEMMVLESADSLEVFVVESPQSFLLNFSQTRLEEIDSPDTIVVGCEGGLTPDEVSLFADRVVGLNTPLVLKSESAVCAVASKILL